MKSNIVKALGVGLFGLIAISMSGESSGAGLLNLLQSQKDSAGKVSHTTPVSRTTPIVQEVSSDSDEALPGFAAQRNARTTPNREHQEPSSNTRSLMNFGDPYFPKASSNNETPQVSNRREPNNENRAVVPARENVRRQGVNNEATAYDNFARESIRNGLPLDVLSKLRASKSNDKKGLSGSIDIWGADKLPADLRQLEDIQGKQKFYISIMGQVFPLYTGIRIGSKEQIDVASIAVAGYELNEDTVGNQLIKEELKNFYGEAEELRKEEIAAITEQNLQARKARIVERDMLLQSEILRRQRELETQAQINRDRAEAELNNVRAQIAEEMDKRERINAELSEIIEQVRNVSEELAQVKASQQKLLVALSQQKQVLNQNHSELQKSAAKNHRLEHEINRATEEAKQVEAKLQEFNRANEEVAKQLQKEKEKTLQLHKELQLSAKRNEELQKSLAEERARQNSLRQSINQSNLASGFGASNMNTTSFSPNSSDFRHGGFGSFGIDTNTSIFPPNSSNKF